MNTVHNNQLTITLLHAFRENTNLLFSQAEFFLFKIQKNEFISLFDQLKMLRTIILY